MRTDPVEFVINTINSRDIGVKAHGQVPNPRPDEFARAALTSTYMVSPTHWRSGVTVEVYAADLGRAYDLAQKITGVLIESGDSWASVASVSRWPGGPVPVPDPDSGTPRIVMTCAINHKVSDD